MFRLSDDTGIRKSKGDGQEPFDVVGAFLRDKQGLSDFNLNF